MDTSSDQAAAVKTDTPMDVDASATAVEAGERMIFSFFCELFEGINFC
jgi:hypothetical protein